MTALGALYRPALPPEELRETVLTAEEAGLEQLWLWEDCFYQSGIASAAAALAWTERLTVGIGVVPAPMRNAAMTAMETATLQRMSGGRFRLGIGHGSQDWMAQAGVKAASPLTLMREHLTTIRPLLRGERVTHAGRYVNLDEVQLEWPPANPAPVLVGARGPRSLELSGELADGTVLPFPTSPEDVAKARELIDKGRARAGRTDHHHLAVYIAAAAGPGATARLQAELGSFGLDLPPEYADGVSAETVAKAVRRLADAGADTVIVGTTAVEPDPAGFIRFVAHEVRPLVP
ncbi:LLM class flavin-dependent oxidoreductase [Streptomyces sp. NPDC004838]